MTFQRAPPERNGFAFTTLTPGLIRSFQDLMCFGLPGRVTNTVTESVTIPPCGSLVHFFETSPELVSLWMSGARANATTSAGRPFFTARLCWPDAPYDWLKFT